MRNKTQSVLVCCFNAEMWIADCLNSILMQSVISLQVVVVDDCSTDSSVKIIEEFQRLDPRIELIKNSGNIGFARSQNKGLKACVGEIIFRLDDDDVCMHKDRFLQHLDVYQADRNIGIVGSDGWVLDEGSKTIGVLEGRGVNPHDIRNIALGGSPFAHSSVSYRRDAINGLGGYTTWSRYCSDLELWIRAVNTGYGLYCIPQKLIGYRKRFSSVSKATSNYGLIALTYRANAWLSSKGKYISNDSLFELLGCNKSALKYLKRESSKKELSRIVDLGIVELLRSAFGLESYLLIGELFKPSVQLECLLDEIESIVNTDSCES